MSVAEKKLEMINKIAVLDNEALLNKVYELLYESKEAEKNSLNLGEHYDAIKEQYGDVLQKLAQ